MNILTAPDQFLTAALESWRSAQRRRAVPPTFSTSEFPKDFPLTAMPSLPGSGEVSVPTQAIPIVTVSGMPPEAYVGYMDALMGYTLATLAVERPFMAVKRNDSDMIRMSGLVVATRCGMLRALRVMHTDHIASACPVARYSARHQKIVTRPVAEEDALWLHFLATQTGSTGTLREAMMAVAGVAPLLFLLGGTLHCRSGETYAMHYIERDIRAFLRASLSREAALAMALDQAGTIEMLAAAAVGGFRASFIKQVCEDPAFVTRAHMITASDEKPELRARLAKLRSSCGEFWYVGAAMTPSVNRLAKLADIEPDDVSVVDTEADGLAPDVANMADFEVAGSRASTPRVNAVQMTHEDAEAIREVARGVREAADYAVSGVANFDADRTAKF